MKEKNTSTESASGICYETMETHALSCIQSWLQDLLEAGVTEFLGRGKSQHQAVLTLDREKWSQEIGQSWLGKTGLADK